MVFQVLPEAGPVTIGSQQTSQIFEFFVPDEAEQMFLRYIALFQDNDPLGGEAPTFQIRAGTGVFTSVGPASGSVSIPNGAGQTVGSVSCVRKDLDIFLLTISDPVENSGPWKIRIRNNDPESLRFFGFSSQHEDETLQPWMVLGNSKDVLSSGGFFEMRNEGESSRDIEIRNWGTTQLRFNEVLGPLKEDASLSLTTLPATIDPHQLKQLTIQCTVENASPSAVHFLNCNDTNKDHTRLAISVLAPSGHPSGGGVLTGGSTFPGEHLM
jgi:hypothetical protein